uniref:Uncharacterized protein n=1 Tax=Lepeophtheirus salmonis TaxID=72036 RepID=A0A0K2V642_LEPSM
MSTIMERETFVASLVTKALKEYTLILVFISQFTLNSRGVSKYSPTNEEVNANLFKLNASLSLYFNVQFNHSFLFFKTLIS